MSISVICPRPMASLNLLAENYTLLNAKRTRESLVYGKVFCGLAGNHKGPLDGLNMRGNLNLLGNTDVSYVLTDSPLDRAGSSGKSGDIYFIQWYHHSCPSGSAYRIFRWIGYTDDGSLSTLQSGWKWTWTPVTIVSNWKEVAIFRWNTLPQETWHWPDVTHWAVDWWSILCPIIAVKEFAIDNGSYVGGPETRWTHAELQGNRPYPCFPYPKERTEEREWLTRRFHCRKEPVGQPVFCFRRIGPGRCDHTEWTDSNGSGRTWKTGTLYHVVWKPISAPDRSAVEAAD